MGQHFEPALSDGQVVHAGYFLPAQELVSGYIGPNFRLERANATTVQVVAGSAGDEQVSVAIPDPADDQWSRWRYVAATVQAAIPGGDGTRDIYVTAEDNDFSGPTNSPDQTDYSFALAVRASGSPPATALYRKVGEVVVASGAITELRQTVDASTGATLPDDAIQGSARVSVARQPGGGLLLDLEGDSVGTAQIAPDGVGTAEIAANAVTASEIAALAVGTAELAADAVTAAKVGAGEVGSSELATNSVGSDEIQADAVGTSEIAANAVTASEIATDAVGTTELDDGAVTSAKAALTSDSAAATASLTLTGSDQDVPGATLSVTPDVASIVLVWATFDFEINPVIGGVVSETCIGELSVDGSDQAAQAILSAEAQLDADAQLSSEVLRGTVTQHWRVSLTAAAHTLKLQASEDGNGGVCRQTHTKLSYLLFAA